MNTSGAAFKGVSNTYSLAYQDNGEEKDRLQVFACKNVTADQESSIEFRIQIERGSNETAYVPYRGTIDTIPIPQAVRDMCPLYGASAGSAYNYIDFERKAYVQRVGSVDLGTLTWFHAGDYFYADIAEGKQSSGSVLPNLICGSFGPVVTGVEITAGTAPDKSIGAGTNETATRVIIRDSSHQTAEEFKAAFDGTAIYCELATPVEVDLSSVLTDDAFTEVEAGGSLTFENSHGDDYAIPVPNRETFLVSVQDAL